MAVKNHHNGTLDPYAHFQTEITVDQVLASPPVCHPLRLLDCCPQTDGAAAVILVNAERAHEFTDKPVFVAGFGVATDHPYLHEKSTFIGLPATTAAAERAYAMAGVGPDQIDMAEVHDCFTITEILDIEDLGFVEKGKGGVGHAWRARRRSTAGSRSTPRVACWPRATRSGPPVWPRSPSATGSCGARSASARSTIRHGNALQHNVGGRGSGVSVVNILTTNR